MSTKIMNNWGGQSWSYSHWHFDIIWLGYIRVVNIYSWKIDQSSILRSSIYRAFILFLNLTQYIVIFWIYLLLHSISEGATEIACTWLPRSSDVLEGESSSKSQISTRLPFLWFDDTARSRTPALPLPTWRLPEMPSLQMGFHLGMERRWLAKTKWTRWNKAENTSWARWTQ